jgi:hypothetical protein
VHFETSVSNCLPRARDIENTIVCKTTFLRKEEWKLKFSGVSGM